MAVRVVIAEDEAIVRLDLKEIMEEEGYEIVGETGRGDEAVELVRAQRPDLVILDIKMPGVDGLTAAREISAERLCAVLILTAFSQRDLIEQARNAGALAYLVKPFQKSELLPAIEMAIGRFSEMKALDEQVRPSRSARNPNGHRPGQGDPDGRARLEGEPSVHVDPKPGHARSGHHARSGQPGDRRGPPSRPGRGLKPAAVARPRRRRVAGPAPGPGRSCPAPTSKMSVPSGAQESTWASVPGRKPCAER